ncbi:hypothetical protein A0H81_09226 [Grifola frondosa]|uniref:Uncharacterized protein n=1 Tax=Grifola frondosa TaxID=5627 RepID=A0A1C7M738_GRIFR|nr:hypothetical protein A0H81_09226 [Grifola frondosa]
MPVSRARSVPPSPKSLLSLKLSGPSFLDTVIRDESTKEPLYIIETVREVTTVHRLDPVLSLANKTATVEWPLTPVRIKGKSGRTVQLGNGSWRDVEDFFKVGPLGNTAIRKFQLPHYPHTLKWKLVLGNCFCCTTSGIKGPVAVLDAATLSAPPRLKIYHTLINGEAALSQHNHHGVPTILLDYLIITALLLVTDVQEWLDRPSHDTGGTRIPGSSSYMVQRWLAIIHNRPLPPRPPTSTSLSPYPILRLRPRPSVSMGRWDSQSGTTSASGSNWVRVHIH